MEEAAQLPLPAQQSRYEASMNSIVPHCCRRMRRIKLLSKQAVLCTLEASIRCHADAAAR